MLLKIKQQNFFFFIYTPVLFILLLVLLQCQSKQSESEAVRFAKFAQETFKEVYPALAQQILGDYKITEGTCFDLGCGPGFLSIEIAKRSNLNIIGVDIDKEVVQLARNFVEQARLENQIEIEQGDVQQLRFKDNIADLIVSRGSFIFWDNIIQGFREIFRVLKPGGIAFIGGGMGRTMPLEKRTLIKQKVDQSGFRDRCKHIIGLNMMLETMEHANIKDFKIIPDGPEDATCPCGLWVEIRKNSE